jgi:hypothetical protein
MTLQDAIRELQQRRHDNGKWLWMRPVTWKGWRRAFCLSADGKTTEIVPTLRGGEQGMTAHVSDLLTEWEVVRSIDVLREGEE